MSQPQDPFGPGGHPGWGQPGWGPPHPLGPQHPQPHLRPQPYPHPGWGPQPWGPQPWGQQPWAQPGPWGPPPAPEPPRRRRRWPWLLAVLALVVVAAVAVPLALRRTALDPQAVQRDVAAQYQQLRGGDLQLRCDADMPVEVGRSYRCTGTTGSNAPVTITIRITGRDGAYTWSGGS